MGKGGEAERAKKVSLLLPALLSDFQNTTRSETLQMLSTFLDQDENTFLLFLTLFLG